MPTVPSLPRATEKQEMALADKAAKLLGFVVVNFSQARASKQTPGIPDRLYLHEGRGAAFWFECKREGGRVSVAQRRLHEALGRAGHTVCVGTSELAIRELERIVADRSPLGSVLRVMAAGPLRNRPERGLESPNPPTWPSPCPSVQQVEAAKRSGVKA